MSDTPVLTTDILLFDEDRPRYYLDVLPPASWHSSPTLPNWMQQLHEHWEREMLRATFPARPVDGIVSTSMSGSAVRVQGEIQHKLLEELYAMPRTTSMLDLVDAWWMPTHEQFRFPRSKKKRVRAKWAKDRTNWRKRKPVVLLEHESNRMYCSPDVYRELKNAMSAPLNLGMSCAD